MIDARDLVRALDDRAEIADWVLLERDQELAAITSGVRRAEQRKRWQLTVHHDVPSGRGSAHVEIDAVAGDADVIVDQALALAKASIGPAWRSSPPAAAARIPLADDALLVRDPLEAAGELSRSFDVRVLRETVSAASKQGFHHAWQATRLDVHGLVTAGEHAMTIAREARRVADVDLDAATADARAQLAMLARASAPPPGPCAIVLAADAMLHGGLGVWAAFASQADAVVERLGLTRYREHAPIAPGAEQAAEPLSITSDGALPFGVRSAPLGAEGDAVRRWVLVDHGIAAGLALSPREAALRGRDPNGGVRNLDIALGTWNGEAAGRIVEIRRLRDLAIDPYTGEASLEIALGVAGNAPFAGGTVRLDLIAALAHARRSATRLARGPYVGPHAVLIEQAEVIA